MERIRLNGGGHTSPKLIVDTKCLPVSLNKSSPPSKSSDVDIPHQIIRPTPRRAIDISAVDNLRFVQVGTYLDLLVFGVWIFGMAAITFLCNGTLLFQGNLPRILPVLILKYGSCLIPYINSFLFLCAEWSSLVFRDFQKYFFKPNV